MWIIRPPLDNKGNFEKLSLFLLVEKSGEFTYLFFYSVESVKKRMWKSKGSWKTLHFFSALERSYQGEFVGVFEVGSDRHAVCKPAHAHAERLYYP